jgi:prepilin-type processing-associated H-X9-DG protein
MEVTAMGGQRKGFGITLLEVVVLLIIFAILLFLCLPRIGSRESGPRNTCSNNMRQLALALQYYEQHHRAYPGYANVIKNKRASWAVPLLPYLERNDLYQNWQNTEPVALPLPEGSSGFTLNFKGQPPNPWTHANLDIFLCPSSLTPHDATNPISFIVNCGSARTANDNLPPILPGSVWIEDYNSGVFFNRAGGDFSTTISQSNPNPPKGSFSMNPGPPMTMTFIATHDGTSTTLLLSENLQSTNWVTDPSDQANHPPKPFQSEFQIKQNMGFVWFITGNQDNALPPSQRVQKLDNFNPESMQINAMSKAIGKPVRVNYSSVIAPKQTGGLAASRPSSGHPGGVNAMFCDAHLRFISEDIDYRVYTHLMTPNGAAVVIDSGPTPHTAREAAWTYELNENDY